MLPLPPPPIKHGTYDAPALIEKNLRRTCKNSIVEQSTASSRWTALVLREVNKPPHCFVVLLRPIFTMNAPKSSHAVWWKGGVQGARRSCGRSAINCDSTLCSISRQNTRQYLTELTRSWALMIQYFYYFFYLIPNFRSRPFNHYFFFPFDLTQLVGFTDTWFHFHAHTLSYPEFSKVHWRFAGYSDGELVLFQR